MQCKGLINMNIPFLRGSGDGVDLAALAGLVLALVFAATFFWQASAGADRGEASYREELHRRIGKAIMKERERIAHLLVLEEEGPTDAEAWQSAVDGYDTYSGNSQFHLVVAGVHAREEGRLAEALAEYRRAIELNKEYSDSRSPYYRGEELEPLVARAKKEILPAGGEKAAVADLFYIERSLAGGCH
jgi:hypothetical protein